MKQLESEREGGELTLRQKIAELEVNTHTHAHTHMHTHTPSTPLQAKNEGLTEEKEGVVLQLTETERVREEFVTDNRRLAEIVVAMEREAEEAASMLESLTRERKELRRQCEQLRKNGERELGGGERGEM